MSKARCRTKSWSKHGVKIIGYSNTPSRLAADASALFARNLYNFLSAFWDKEG
jgi:NAD(P) transhydrogenase subunit alpha